MSAMTRYQGIGRQTRGI